MYRLLAAVVFLLLYVAGLIVVCELNAAYIIRDAVIGPMTVAGVYMILLAPTAAAGVGTITLMTASPHVRFALAIAFSLTAATAVGVLLSAAQHEATSEAIRRMDLTLFGATDVVLAATFAICGFTIDRANRRKSQAA